MRCCSFRCAKPFLAGVSLLVLLVSSCSTGIDVIPSAGTAVPECSITLDEDILARLSLSLYPSIEMRPGESRELSVGVIECCMFLDPVDACTTWSVEPSEGATISPDGELTIDPTTPGGAVFRVTADVEDGRQQVSADVTVYDPAENPLVGTWHEEAQVACGSQAEVAPEKPIQELRFFADGRVNVTWAPFETYVDYSGTYTFSEDGSIELSIAGGNYTPDDLDGTGRFTIDEEGCLVLEDMWLGSPEDGGDTTNCGHRFR
jgi:hypothetical protein